MVEYNPLRQSQAKSHLGTEISKETLSVVYNMAEIIGDKLF